MTSLRESVETLVCGFGVSRYPGLYKEWEDRYIKELEDELERIFLIPNQERESWNPEARKLWFDGFNLARQTALKFLKGENGNMRFVGTSEFQCDCGRTHNTMIWAEDEFLEVSKPQKCQCGRMWMVAVQPDGTPELYRLKHLETSGNRG